MRGEPEDGVIAKTAALAAREHGDARKAMDILYESGRLAETERADRVTEKHVDDALKRAEINRFQKLVSGRTPHVKHILRALALLTEQAGTSPLSDDRVQRLLKDQSFLGVTESEYTGGGHGEGSFRVHRLLRSPDVVAQGLDAT
ncbi:hypothetical protein [Halopenitus sp. POP-27]|uniref:hypothetical protein n=1 Tax=Halopenitus sp. POP-27 TaxID=2994425 RepID=UPI002469639E|nr:hypothetical protein [Halopenitus sp. POP-27]